MRLTACVLALWPLVACTQRAAVATAPAHAGVESACDRLSRLAHTTKPRLFAAVEIADRHDEVVWREFESREARVEVEPHKDAEAWTSGDGWLVSMSEGSPAGDWLHSVDYCFRGDQSLARIDSSLGTVYAQPNPVMRSRVTSFSPDGRQLSQVTTVTDQVTRQVLTASSFKDMQEEIFKTVRDLPFARFFQLKKRAN